jgi:hypothetical protein
MKESIMVNERMQESMGNNERMKESTNEWRNRWMNESINESMNESRNELVPERVSSSDRWDLGGLHGGAMQGFDHLFPAPPWCLRHAKERLLQAFQTMLNQGSLGFR